MESSREVAVGLFQDSQQANDAIASLRAAGFSERGISLFVHFSKGSGRRFLRDDLPDISYPERAEARLAGLTGSVSGGSGPSRWPAPLRRAVRTLAPSGTRRGAAVTSLARKLVR